MVMMTQETDLMELLFGEQGSFLTMNGEVAPPTSEVADQRLDPNEYRPIEEDYVTFIPDMDTLLEDDDVCPKDVEVTVETVNETPSTSSLEEQGHFVFQFPSTSQTHSEISDDLLSIATEGSLLTDLTDTESTVPSTPFSPQSPFSLPPPTPDSASTDSGVKQRSVKDDLRSRIQIKRRQEGKAEIKVEFVEPEPEKLTEEEQAKRVEKREKNKLAAQKCREKKRQRAEVLEAEIRDLQSKKSVYEMDIKKLIEERDHLMDIINVHSSVCPEFRAHSAHL